MASSIAPEGASPADAGLEVNQKLWDKVQSLVDKFQPGVSLDLPPPQQSQKLREIFINNVWPAIRDDYDRMTKVLITRLKNGLKNQSIDAEVTGRAKEVGSAVKTLERRENYLFEHGEDGFKDLLHIFSEMHDLSGIRIVLQYREDLEKAQKFIDCVFDQRKEPVHFDPNRPVGHFWRKPWFRAYETYNHRVELPRLAEENQAMLSGYAGVMFEIQLTTFADNLYNKLAHDLLYKAPPGLVTSQDEMVIDLSHGVAHCFELCIRILKDKLKGNVAVKKDNMADQTTEVTAMAEMMGSRQAKEAQSAVDDFESDFETLPARKKTSTIELLSQLVAHQLGYVNSKFSCLGFVF